MGPIQDRISDAIGWMFDAIFWIVIVLCMFVPAIAAMLALGWLKGQLSPLAYEMLVVGILLMFIWKYWFSRKNNN